MSVKILRYQRSENINIQFNRLHNTKQCENLTDRTHEHIQSNKYAYNLNFFLSSETKPLRETIRITAA